MVSDKVRLPGKDLLSTLKQMDREIEERRSAIRAAGVEYMEVYYEDLRKDLPRALCSVLSFLDLPHWDSDSFAIPEGAAAIASRLQRLMGNEKLHSDPSESKETCSRTAKRPPGGILNVSQN